MSKHIWIIEERYGSDANYHKWTPASDKHLDYRHFIRRKDAKRAIFNMEYCAHANDLRVRKYVREER